MFRDTITVNIKDVTTKEVEFREVRNFGGVENSLNSLFNSEEHLGYAIYIYQPQEKSFQKRLLLTNINLIKNIGKLQSMYIEEQATINKGLKLYDHILLSKDEPSPDTQYLHDIGMNYILVQRIRDTKGMVGEIHFVFESLPDQKTIEKLTTELRKTIFLNVI